MIIGADISPETEVFTSELAHFIDFPMEIYLINKTENNLYVLTYKSKVINKLEGRDGRLILRFQYTDIKDSVAIYYFNKYLIDYLQSQNISEAKSIKRYAASANFEQEIELFNTQLSIETDDWDSRLQKISISSYFSQTINYNNTKTQKQGITSVDSGSLAELVAVAANLCDQQPAIIPIEMHDFNQYQHILKSGFRTILSKRQFNRIQDSEGDNSFFTKAMNKMWGTPKKTDPPEEKSLDTAQFRQNGIVCNISYEAIAACRALNLSAAELNSLIPDNLSAISDDKWEDWNLFIFFACFSSILKSSDFKLIVHDGILEFELADTAEEIKPPKRSPLNRKFHQVSELCKKWALNNNIKCKTEVHNA
jgi:hypothetical protein